MLGYEFVETKEEAHYDSLFKVPIGKEDEAVSKFESYGEIVFGAFRLDRKFEERINEIDNVIGRLRNLRDNVEELSDEKYASIVRGIKSLL